MQLQLPAADPVFSLRIVALDHYQAPPTPGLDVTFSSLEGTSVDLVPIVRVFGSTPAGQRVCLHLHQAFPYFYVPYSEDLPTEPAEAAHFLRRLALAINTAMNMSGGMAATAAAAAAAAGPAQPFAANTAAAGQPDSSSSRRRKQYVADLLLVKAKPIYGYYAHEALFIKIVLYNPGDISRASLLLGSGAILGRRFQPYEAHIPFLLQLKIDFNLVGMGWLKMQRVLFRQQQQQQSQDPGTPPQAAAAAARDIWDPWNANSSVHIAYDLHQQLQQQQQQQISLQQQQLALQQQQQRGGSLGSLSPSGLVGSVGSSQGFEGCGVVWNSGSVPKEWTWEAYAAETGVRAIPAPQSTCALECDATVQDILNPQDALYIPLEQATADQQLVASLIPMWQQERWRLGGGSIPPPLGSPPRRPQPLSTAVEAVREEFRGISRQHAAALAAAAGAQQQQHTDQGTPTSQQQQHQTLTALAAAAAAADDSPIKGLNPTPPAARLNPSLDHYQATPAHLTPAAAAADMPSRHRQLLDSSQPANKTLGTGRLIKTLARTSGTENPGISHLDLGTPSLDQRTAAAEAVAAAGGEGQGNEGAFVPASPLLGPPTAAAAAAAAGTPLLATAAAPAAAAAHAADGSTPFSFRTPVPKFSVPETPLTAAAAAETPPNTAAAAAENEDHGLLVNSQLVSQLYSQQRSRKMSRSAAAAAGPSQATPSGGSSLQRAGSSSRKLRRKTSAALAAAAAAVAAAEAVVTPGPTPGAAAGGSGSQGLGVTPSSLAGLLGPLVTASQGVIRGPRSAAAAAAASQHLQDSRWLHRNGSSSNSQDPVDGLLPGSCAAAGSSSSSEVDDSEGHSEDLICDLSEHEVHDEDGTDLLMELAELADEPTAEDRSPTPVAKRYKKTSNSPSKPPAAAAAAEAGGTTVAADDGGHVDDLYHQQQQQQQHEEMAIELQQDAGNKNGQDQCASEAVEIQQQQQQHLYSADLAAAEQSQTPAAAAIGAAPSPSSIMPLQQHPIVDRGHVSSAAAAAAAAAESQGVLGEVDQGTPITQGSADDAAAYLALSEQVEQQHLLLHRQQITLQQRLSQQQQQQQIQSLYGPNHHQQQQQGDDMIQSASSESNTASASDIDADHIEDDDAGTAAIHSPAAAAAAGRSRSVQGSGLYRSPARTPARSPAAAAAAWGARGTASPGFGSRSAGLILSPSRPSPAAAAAAAAAEATDYDLTAAPDYAAAAGSASSPWMGSGRSLGFVHSPVAADSEPTAAAAAAASPGSGRTELRSAYELLQKQRSPFQGSMHLHPQQQQQQHQQRQQQQQGEDGDQDPALMIHHPVSGHVIPQLDGAADCYSSSDDEQQQQQTEDSAAVASAAAAAAAAASQSRDTTSDSVAAPVQVHPSPRTNAAAAAVVTSRDATSDEVVAPVLAHPSPQANPTAAAAVRGSRSMSPLSLVVLGALGEFGSSSGGSSSGGRSEAAASADGSNSRGHVVPPDGAAAAGAGAAAAVSHMGPGQSVSITAVSYCGDHPQQQHVSAASARLITGYAAPEGICPTADRHAAVSAATAAGHEILISPPQIPPADVSLGVPDFHDHSNDPDSDPDLDPIVDPNVDPGTGTLGNDVDAIKHHSTHEDGQQNTSQQRQQQHTAQHQQQQYSQQESPSSLQPPVDTPSMRQQQQQHNVIQLDDDASQQQRSWQQWQQQQQGGDSSGTAPLQLRLSTDADSSDQASGKGVAVSPDFGAAAAAGDPVAAAPPIGSGTAISPDVIVIPDSEPPPTTPGHRAQQQQQQHVTESSQEHLQGIAMTPVQLDLQLESQQQQQQQGEDDSPRLARVLSFDLAAVVSPLDIKATPRINRLDQQQQQQSSQQQQQQQPELGSQQQQQQQQQQSSQQQQQQQPELGSQQQQQQQQRHHGAQLPSGIAAVGAVGPTGAVEHDTSQQLQQQQQQHLESQMLLPRLQQQQPIDGVAQQRQRQQQPLLPIDRLAQQQQQQQHIGDMDIDPPNLHSTSQPMSKLQQQQQQQPLSQHNLKQQSPQYLPRNPPHKFTSEIINPNPSLTHVEGYKGFKGLEDLGSTLNPGVITYTLRPVTKPPNPSTAAADMVLSHGLNPVLHVEPFYGNPADKPAQPTVFAGREFRISASTDISDFTTHSCVTDNTAAAATAGGSTAITKLKTMIKRHPPAIQQQQQQLALLQQQQQSGGGISGDLDPQQQQQQQQQRRDLLQQQLQHALQTSVGLPQRYQGVIILKLPVKPPTRTQTEAWLAAQHTAVGTRSRSESRVPAAAAGIKPLGAPKSGSGSSALAAAAALGQQQQRGNVTDDSGFRMDTTTGKLMPVTPAAARSAAAGSSAAAAAEDEELGLLATPALLLSMPSQTQRDEVSDYHHHQQQQQQQRQGGSQGALGLRSPHSAAAASSSDRHQQRQQQQGDEDPSDPESDYEEPASPKYDERTFFFSGLGLQPSTTRKPSTSRRKQRAEKQGLQDNPTAAIPPAAAAAGIDGVSPGPRSPAGTSGGTVTRSPGSSAGVTPGPTLTSGTSGGTVSLHIPGHTEHITPPVVPPGSATAAAAAANTAAAAVGRTLPSQLGFKQQGGGSKGSGFSGPRSELSILSVEIHAESRGSLLPDPRYDSVRVIALVIMTPPPPGSSSSSGSSSRNKVVKYLVWDDKHPAAVAAAAAKAQQQQQQPVPAAAAANSKDTAAAAASILAKLPSLPIIDAPVASCPPDPDYDGVLRTLSLNRSVHRVQDLVTNLVTQGSAQGGTRPRVITNVTRVSSDRSHNAGMGQDAAGGLAMSGTNAQPQQQQQSDLGSVHADPDHSSDPAAAAAVAPVQLHYYANETSLLQGFCAVVQALDPDVIVGWDLQQGSLGYSSDRGALLGFNLLRAVSKTPELPGLREGSDDAWGRATGSGLHATGRILLNVWRLLSSELKLSHYSLENCVAAVLRKRVPHIGPAVMTTWFNAGHAGGRWRCLSRVAWRASLVLDLLDTLDLPGRTAELARTFGIDFFSVINRGSQYRVESMLVRLAHSQNYLTLSPNKEQVGSQPATEALPLVMEPESRLYSCPVVVLDFQSLYPSMVIAYNLCYSTCVGRPAHAAAATAAADLKAHPRSSGSAGSQHNDDLRSNPDRPAVSDLRSDLGSSDQQPPGSGVRLGVSNYAPPPDALLPGAAADPEGLVLAPNGVGFLSPSVRPGVLPRLLHEILATRVMVKAAMKRNKADKVLQRCLNARQFGLKMIANVSYGYTSASFSGRMPFAELADSIVQSGRVTLENAIRLVEGHPDWRARVVYGDTDSMFVALAGRTRAEAHQIGAEIAREVTAANPRPVTLKMEKVYYPCILQTKKRYVGFAYESADQTEPVFDAKGIETVRRDSCPAVAKMLESCLRVLFSSKDLSAVKEYCTRQWGKILSNRVSIQDFMFCKEVRLGTYSPNAATLPPAAIVAAKAMAADPRAEPRYAERIPYVVVAGAPGSRLVDLVVSPQALVQQDPSRASLRLHANYYITKQIIPALERVLSLVGADVRSWYSHMKKPTRLLPQKRPATSLGIPTAAIGYSSPRALAAAAGAAAAGGNGEKDDAEDAGAGFGLAAALAGYQPPTAGTSGSSRGVGAGLFGPSAAAAAAANLSATIDTYYLSRHCAVCDELTRAAEPLCEQCRSQPQITAVVLASRAARLERQHQHLVRLCQTCGGAGGWNVRHGGVVCTSLDCGVYYERYKVMGELRAMSAVAAAGMQML